MIDSDHIDAVALAVRARLRPRLSVLDAVPLDLLAEQIVLGEHLVQACLHEMLPPSVWGLTTFRGERATIWLNAEAWPELARSVPRTRFTVAHELGHVMLHGDALEGLDDHAEPEHQAQIEREANTFAAHLLIPDAAFKRLNVEPSSAASDVLAKRFGVSVAMATKRIDEWRAKR